MNKKLETLLELVSTWPEEAQDELMKSIAEIEARHAASIGSVTMNKQPSRRLCHRSRRDSD